MTFKELELKLPRNLLEYLKLFKNVPQDLKWHPEGNTYNHIVLVVNNVSKYNDPDLTMAALFHDFGKDRTTEIHDDGHITSHGHSEVSLEVVDMFQDFIKQMGANFRIVRNLVRFHMSGKPELIVQMNSKLRRQIENDTVFFDKLMKLVEADKMK